MARPTKRRIEAGGGPAAPPKAGAKAAARSGNPKKAAAAVPDDADHHSRYTPPTSAALHAPSPLWVPILMFALLGIGFLVIFLNYTDLLPGSPNSWYLIGGLGGILAGIITATQLR